MRYRHFNTEMYASRCQKTKTYRRILRVVHTISQILIEEVFVRVRKTKAVTCGSRMERKTLLSVYPFTAQR